VEHLAGEIGTRFAGSSGEAEAAEYMQGLLASYGYDATIQPFPFETVTQYDTQIVVEVPGAGPFATAAMGGTATGTAEGEIVTAGIGRASEFAAGTDGKIALIERGELTFGQKAANAEAAGAVGAIIYNNEEGPFIGQLDTDVSIPVVSMPRADGVELESLLGGQAVVARLSVDIQTSEGESRNVIAEPPGGECRIVVGGHYDSVANGPGANDNGSGTAVVIEMARALAADGLFDDVCFVLFGAEEIGLLGSNHYVSSLTEGELGGIEAMLNFDMLGVGHEWPLGGVGSIVEIMAGQADALGLSYRLSDLPANVGSDHASFTAVGIPAVIVNCFCDPNYHTSQDASAFVEPERLKDAGDLGMATVDALLAGE
jgi:aminopeptidase YwaD